MDGPTQRRGDTRRSRTSAYSIAKLNEDPKDVILREYEEEIKRLKTLIDQKIELQERSHLKSAVKPQKKSPAKDQNVTDLLEKQKRIEEKYKDELRTLLEPHGIKVDGSLPTIMAELERRKAALMKDGEEVKEGNKRLYEQLEKATQSMMDSKRQCKELFRRVLFLEDRIQKSHVTNEELKTKEKELAEQRLRESTLRKTLEQKTMTSNDLKGELSKVQLEIERKQKQITRFRCKVAEHKEKTQMLERSHQDNMQQLLILKKDLSRELQLKKLIVDNLIPRKVRKKIEERIRYDDVGDKYILAPRTDTTFEQPPVNRMLINPYLNLTRFPRMPKQNNVYYSNENLLAVEPEAPIPRSQELVLEDEDPAITNLIAETIRELNQELVIVCDHRKGRHKTTL